MIEIFIVTLSAFGLAMIGMGVGVLTKRRGLAGSCAGLRTASDDVRPCQACGRSSDRNGYDRKRPPTETMRGA